MEIKKIFIPITLFFLIIVLSGCTTTNTTNTEESYQPKNEQTDKVGLANPASVFCTEKGGTLEIRNTTEGQVGYCLFNDNSECEEWKFFRGECKPGETAETKPTDNPATGTKPTIIEKIISKPTIQTDIIKLNSPSDIDIIKSAFLKKYPDNWNENKLTIVCNKKTDTHARCLPKQEGHFSSPYILTTKENNTWSIVFVGQDIPLCSSVLPYNFPTSIVNECWDDINNEWKKLN